MTNFEKAMKGDSRAAERFFFGKGDGSNLPDCEMDVIFNFKLTTSERVARIAAMRGTKPGKAKRTVYAPVRFEALIGEADSFHARAMGISLS